MKTAVVPNSPGLTALMDVTAELSVSLECYENHFRNRYRVICADNVQAAMDDLTAAELNPPQWELVEKAIQKAVRMTALDQATLIKCHEATLGHSGPSAPANIALEGIEAYWREVNG